jgi:hypothetical protein
MTRLWRSRAGALSIGIALALVAWLLIGGFAYFVLRCIL